MRVGDCRDIETNLTECSGGMCHDMEVGGVCKDVVTLSCMMGAPVGLKIKCNGSKGRHSSCEKGAFCYLIFEVQYMSGTERYCSEILLLFFLNVKFENRVSRHICHEDQAVITVEFN